MNYHLCQLKTNYKNNPEEKIPSAHNSDFSSEQNINIGKRSRPEDEYEVEDN